DLLDALCEESITAEQVQRLEELILTYPEAEAYYVQFMSLHADLVGHFGLLPARTEQSLRDRVQCPDKGQRTKDEGRRKDPRVFRTFSFVLRPWFISLSALAAGLLLVLALWPRQPAAPSRHSSEPPEALDETVAVLLQAPGAEWNKTGLVPRTGAPLI